MSPHQRDQLASQYFKKSVQLIASARLTGFPSPSATDPPVKVDRWFNLEGPNTKHFDVELAEYKQLSLNHPQAVSAASSSSRRDAAVAATAGRVPAFMLEIVLDASFSSKDDVLVLEGKDGVKGRVATPGGDDGPRRIVIERWRIGLDPARSHMANQNIPLSTTYKNLIPFFRSLYAIIRLLPAHDLRRRIGSGRQPTSSLRLTAVASSEGSLYGLPEGFVPLNAPVGAEGVPEETVKTWKSEGVDHEFGVFSIECAYRPNVAFHLESKDSMSASSVLIEEQYFVPTMARHRRLSRESQTRPTTPSSSLPRRSGLVSQTSLDTPGVSSPVETQERPKLATMSSRQMIESLSGLHGHSRSASAMERRGSEEGLAGASSMSRRESSEGAEPRGIPIGSPKPMNAYDDEQARFTPSPSGQAGSLPRRTTLPHPQTFRHGSLASSPGLSPSASLRNPVSLSSSNSPSTPSFMQHHPVRRSSLSQGVISPSFSSSSRPPINIPNRPGSDHLPLPDSMPGDVPTPAQDSSSSSSRNLPAPSSSTSPTVPAPPSMTKRYSSSFGHRQGRSFSTLDGSASGSPGSRPSLSGFARASSGAGSLSRQSFMSVSKVSIEDDAEINEFLQMIDSRPTLSAPFGLGSSAFLSSTGGKSSPSIGAGGTSPSSVTRPVTTKSQLSEALKRMAGSYTGNLPGVSSSSSAISSPLPPLSSSPGGFLRREPSSISGGGGLAPSSMSSSPESGPLMPLKRGSLGANNSTSPIAPSPLRSSTEPRPLASFAKSSLSAQSSRPQSLSSGADVIGHHAASQPQSFAKFSVPTSSFSLGAIASSLPADKSKLRERRAGPVLMRGGFTVTSNTSTSSPGDKDSGSSTSGERGGHARSLSERGRTFSDGVPSASLISTDSFGWSRQTSPHPSGPLSSRTGDVASSPRFLLPSLVSPQTTMMNLTASGQSSVTVTGGGLELSRSPSSNLSRASPSPTPGHSTTPLDSPRAQHHVGHQPHPRATAVPLPLSDEDKNGRCDDDDILGRFELDPVGEEDEASASSRLASAVLPVMLPPALPASGLAATRPEYVRNRGSSARGVSSGGGGRGSAADIGAVMGRGGWAFGRG